MYLSRRFSARRRRGRSRLRARSWCRFGSRSGLRRRRGERACRRRGGGGSSRRWRSGCRSRRNRSRCYGRREARPAGEVDQLGRYGLAREELGSGERGLGRERWRVDVELERVGLRDVKLAMTRRGSGIGEGARSRWMHDDMRTHDRKGGIEEDGLRTLRGTRKGMGSMALP